MPFSPVVPGSRRLACLFLMLNLDLATWLRFVGWLALGLIVYFAYGRTHSFLAPGREADDPTRGQEQARAGRRLGRSTARTAVVHASSVAEQTLASGPGRTERRARAGVALVFATNGLVFANVLPRYPEIKDALALTNAWFGARGRGVPARCAGRRAGRRGAGRAVPVVARGDVRHGGDRVRDRPDRVRPERRAAGRRDVPGRRVGRDRRRRAERARAARAAPLRPLDPQLVPRRLERRRRARRADGRGRRRARRPAVVAPGSVVGAVGRRRDRRVSAAAAGPGGRRALARRAGRGARPDARGPGWLRACSCCSWRSA